MHVASHYCFNTCRCARSRDLDRCRLLERTEFSSNTVHGSCIIIGCIGGTSGVCGVGICEQHTSHVTFSRTFMHSFSSSCAHGVVVPTLFDSFFYSLLFICSPIVFFILLVVTFFLHDGVCVQHSDGQCEHTLRLPDSFLACCALSDLRFSFVTMFWLKRKQQSEYHPSW